MDRLGEKIHLIGPSGSGKTTLGSELSIITNSPLVILDDIFYPPPARIMRLDNRETLCQQVAASDRWITEGVYLDGVLPLLHSANQIIWLDLPFSTTFPRLLRRFVRNRADKSREGIAMPPITAAKFALAFLRYYLPRPADHTHFTRINANTVLSPLSEKVTHLRSMSDVHLFRAAQNIRNNPMPQISLTTHLRPSPKIIIT